ncbi:MAG: ankyrin repeat domain-containing protein [Candidatus Babeliales bacterium]
MNYTSSFFLFIMMSCFASQQCVCMDYNTDAFINEFAATEGKRLSYETKQLSKAIESLLQRIDLSDLKDTSPLLNTLLYLDENLSSYLPQLLEKKADPNVEENSCIVINNPIGNALLAHNITATQQLLNAGANPNKQGPVGYPLHYAIKNGDYALVTLLLEHNANPNLLHCDKTPLMQTIEYGNDPVTLAHNRVRIATLLLKNNADKTIHNTEKKSAIDIARSHLQNNTTNGNPAAIDRTEYEKVVQLLEK